MRSNIGLLNTSKIFQVVRNHPKLASVRMEGDASRPVLIGIEGRPAISPAQNQGFQDSLFHRRCHSAVGVGNALGVREYDNGPRTLRVAPSTILRTWFFNSPIMIMFVLVTSLVLAQSTALSKSLDGVGELKFGMNPETVKALPGCSSSTECLYELLGKNRYFALSYDAPAPSNQPARALLADKRSLLRTIDVDMGNYTSAWFLELFEVLQSQYALTHSPTEEEDALFQKGQLSELIIGFEGGHVLLKVVRRTFGNLILRVVFQDVGFPSHIRQSEALLPSSSAPSP